MVHIANNSEFAALFTIPFQRQKIIYSINNDYFESNNRLCKLREKQTVIDIDDEDLLHTLYDEFPCGEVGCRAVFKTVHEYEIHYRSAHRLVCSECKKTFPSYNLLDIHIQERHDSYHQTACEKNLASYYCLVDGCNESFGSVDLRNKHVVEIHKYPKDFKFQNSNALMNKFSEKMDTSESEELTKLSKGTDRNKCSVPRNICFGRGSSRTFQRKRGSKYPSKDITMKELADAL
ncbi:zinc finger protein 511-like [Uloborus diversus]|uniref:zinc finger protein 511-like n=1 Tax=Uloborus diversus TaxID=327109 RepID=UPI002409D194|nr:zinc finger protein 511-like [Uloborus diversus]